MRRCFAKICVYGTLPVGSREKTAERKAQKSLRDSFGGFVRAARVARMNNNLQIVHDDLFFRNEVSSFFVVYEVLFILS
jgi:hypothetical protein